jgi:3-oxoacyl-[acyl-carrier protein] reductase
MNRTFITLTGRVAIVTGAARGIGAATAIELARQGARVVASDLLSCANTVKTIQDFGGEGLSLAADVSASEQVGAMVAKTVEHFGHVDILVNNAGIVHRNVLLETTEAIWDRVMNITLKGPFLCIQAVYPYMKERGYGKIVNVSSISGIIGGAVSKIGDSPEQIRGRSGPGYAAAKGGVIALTRWIAKDVGKDGIYVNAIAPGGCATEMTEGYDYGTQNLPIARMGTPKEMADAIVFLASDASSYITGQVLNVDGGWVMA